jgi:hypothetical protein
MEEKRLREEEGNGRKRGKEEGNRRKRGKGRKREMEEKR